MNHAFALIALAISLCSAAPALAQVDCQAPPIIAPAMHQTVGDLRPAIRWAAVPGASSYRLAPKVRAGQSGPGQRQLHWTRAVNADRCEVLGCAAFDGRLQLMHETREPQLDLPDQAGGLMAIVVRPRCGPVVGTPAYLLD